MEHDEQTCHKKPIHNGKQVQVNGRWLWEQNAVNHDEELTVKRLLADGREDRHVALAASRSQNHRAGDLAPTALAIRFRPFLVEQMADIPMVSAHLPSHVAKRISVAA